MPGYICKVCGGPSPMGVGYAAGEATAANFTDSCPCGYSQHARPGWAADYPDELAAVTA